MSSITHPLAAIRGIIKLLLLIVSFTRKQLYIAFMQKTLSQQINYHIAWRLTQLREAKEISREQLAALINIPVHDIYRFEAAHTAMNARELAIFARGLDVTPNEFYTQLVTKDIDAETLKPISSVKPGLKIIELIHNFLKISCARSRQSFGLATRQAGRHY